MIDLISYSKCTIFKCCTYFDSSLCSCSLPWWYSWNTKSSFLFDTALYRKFGWFFGFSMKNFFTTLSSFLLVLAKALSQFSLLYHISEVFRNVSSYLFDNHFRCQKIIYIIFYTLYEQPWTMMRDGGGVCLFSFIVCRLLLQMSQLSCNGYRRFQFFGMLSFICFFLFSTVFWLIPFFLSDPKQMWQSIWKFWRKIGE